MEPHAHRHPGRSGAAGLTLVEVLVASSLLLVALLGLLPMVSMTVRGNTSDRNQINASNEARRQNESLRALGFDSIGVGVAGSSPPYLGFYELDPGKPGYTASEDTYFVRTVRLASGIDGVLRTVIEAVDDPADGIGGADTDGRKVDYKRLTTTVEWREGGRTRRAQQATLVQGESFVDEDAGGAGGGAPKKSKKPKKTGKAKGKGAKGRGVDSGTLAGDSGKE